jgi:ubiquitin-like protein Pup
VELWGGGPSSQEEQGDFVEKDEGVGYYGFKAVTEGEAKMGAQEKRVKEPPKEEGGGDVKPNTAVVDRARKITEKADELIDEIDEILEQNAEEFVKHFVQRSGE